MKLEIQNDLESAVKKIFSIYNLLENAEWACQDFIENLENDIKNPKQNFDVEMLDDWRKESNEYLFQTLYSSIIIFLFSVFETCLRSLVEDIILEIENNPETVMINLEIEGTARWKRYLSVINNYIKVDLSKFRRNIEYLNSFRNKIVHELSGIVLSNDIRSNEDQSLLVIKNKIGYEYSKESICIMTGVIKTVAKDMGIDCNFVF